MNIKSILKTLKLNESTISMALGVFVLLAIGVIVINFFRSRNNLTPSVDTGQTTENKSEYIVAAGDSLWSIAQKSYNDGFKWVEIAKANNIENPSAIEVGQKLTIPEDTQASTSPTTTAEATATVAAIATEIPTSEPTPTVEPTTEPTAEPSASPAETQTPAPTITPFTETTAEKITDNSYTVVHGDNLWNIAVRAYGDGYKWVEIAQANNLKNPNLIHAGNVFTLPR